MKKPEGKIDILEEWNISKPDKGGFANPNSFCFVNKRKSKSCELRHCFMLPLMLLELFTYLIFGWGFFVFGRNGSAFCRISDERAVLLALSVSDVITCPQFWRWWSCSLLCNAMELRSARRTVSSDSVAVLSLTAPKPTNATSSLSKSSHVVPFPKYGIFYFRAAAYFLGEFYVFWNIIASYSSLKWMY